MTADQLAINPPAAKMRTPELLAALKAHYVKPVDIATRHRGDVGEAELLVEEVPAPGSNRRCDLLRIGMWASRGHRIIVHELKTSRSDFLRELQDPAKAEAWWPYCHEFWIVAPDGLLAPEELPDGWGLMVPPANARTRRFRVKRKASVKEPKLTPLLLVEIAKRIDNARLAQIGELNDTHRNDMARVRRELQVKQTVDQLPYEVQKRLDLLKQLEDELGVPLTTSKGWPEGDQFRNIGAGEVGRALADYVKGHVLLEHKQADLEQQGRHLRATARRVLERTEHFPEREGH